ncbi:hypothetical protein L6164_017819 [Bauhinia variegata]|uniref:Uncharacterized protein n=1 Tax=Bauhinia variegata TaxID=167791 RepID=A0ACB9N9B5_BAUVA|nr:hypothetical protein L6164_017819 [Bauhinia variegata]
MSSQLKFTTITLLLQPMSIVWNSCSDRQEGYTGKAVLTRSRLLSTSIRHCTALSLIAQQIPTITKNSVNGEPQLSKLIAKDDNHNFI